MGKQMYILYDFLAGNIQNNSLRGIIHFLYDISIYLN